MANLKTLPAVRAEGFEHLRSDEVKRMRTLLRRQRYLQIQIHRGEKEGKNMDLSKAEEGALAWAVDWIRKTGKE